MKNIKFLSLILVVIMILTMFTGCEVTIKTNNGKANTDTEANGDSGTDTDISEAVSYNELPNALTSEKIGSINIDEIKTAGDSGIYYKDEQGNYGIMSLSGKTDTGAKYTSCDPIKNFFEVSTSTAELNMDDITTLNCYGVVDAKGNEIIPPKFASFKALGERFIQAIEVTEQTTNKDEHLLYYTADHFSLSASEDDILFKGKWYVYDTETGKPIEGVIGTNQYYITTHGDFIKYVNDAKEEITVNAKGESLPEGADLFDNGYYALEKDNAGAVYDSNHNKLFDYDLTGFIPQDSADEYILASRSDPARKYVLMDKTGKIISGEFADRPRLYGDLIHANQKLYDIKGNAVIEGTYKTVYFDEQLKNTWLLKNDSNFTVIKKDGTILYQGTESDSLSVDSTNFSIYQKDGYEYTFYSLKDKAFTLKGSNLAPWLVKIAQPNNIYDIVDTLSGNTIIQGYKNYSHVDIPGVGSYIYGTKAGGGIDIYIVK